MLRIRTFPHIVGVIILAIAIGEQYGQFYGWCVLGIGCIFADR